MTSKDGSPSAVAKPTSVRLDLEFPVEHEGRRYDYLTFRRMRAGDALAGEDETNQARAGYALFAALAGVSIEVILALDLEDLERVPEVIAPMLGKRGAAALAKATASPSAGATSLPQPQEG